MAADPSKVLTRTMVQPDMPKAIDDLDREQLEENSFRKVVKSQNSEMFTAARLAEKPAKNLRIQS